MRRLAPLICLAFLSATGASAQPLPPGAKYVALGSSFAAGPGVATRAADSPTLCARSDTNYVHAAAALPGAMRQIIAEIRRRAPKARIVFVSYMDILPAYGACPARAPLSAAEIATARALAARLLLITRDVTAEQQVTLVSGTAATKGHDVCAADPWLFDFTFPETPEAFGPIAYHPTVQAMRAIADAIDRAL